jgi:hypothetical protein
MPAARLPQPSSNNFASDGLDIFVGLSETRLVKSGSSSGAVVCAALQFGECHESNRFQRRIEKAVQAAIYT